MSIMTVAQTPGGRLAATLAPGRLGVRCDAHRTACRTGEGRCVAELTSASIDISAPADAVMATISDFSSYPQWVDSIVVAEVLSCHGERAKTVRMVLEHPLVRDDYVLAYEWGPQSVSWKLVSASLLTAMDGSYALAPVPGGTRVTYSLTVDLNVAMIGLFKRKAEKRIIDDALSGLKQRVEG